MNRRKEGGPSARTPSYPFLRVHLLQVQHEPKEPTQPLPEDMNTLVLALGKQIDGWEMECFNSGTHLL